MPFAKGQSGNKKGRPKGSVSEKTRQWDALGEAITTKHTERFNRILCGCEDDKFMALYLQTLEYFKPKLGRTEHTGQDGTPLPAPTIILQGAK